jgi:hypothetical protein
MSEPLPPNTMVTRLSGKERALQLFEAWRRADKDADIEIRTGTSSDGEAAVFVNIAGDTHAFRTSEAMAVIRAIKNTIAKFPREAKNENLDNLLYGLEAGLPNLGEAAK